MFVYTHCLSVSCINLSDVFVCRGFYCMVNKQGLYLHSLLFLWVLSALAFCTCLCCSGETCHLVLCYAFVCLLLLVMKARFFFESIFCFLGFDFKPVFVFICYNCCFVVDVVVFGSPLTWLKCFLFSPLIALVADPLLPTFIIVCCGKFLPSGLFCYLWEPTV